MGRANPDVAGLVRSLLIWIVRQCPRAAEIRTLRYCRRGGRAFLRAGRNANETNATPFGACAGHAAPLRNLGLHTREACTGAGESPGARCIRLRPANCSHG